MRGIAAGYLIALMVWILPFADQLRPLVIVIITYLVGLAAFSHVIAGSVYVPYVVASGGLSVAAFFTDFLVPVFIGNVVGGTSLVALLNYGQVVHEGSD